MKIDNKKLKEILLQENFVTAKDLEMAEEFAKTHHVEFLEFLLTEEIITYALLGQAVAESYKLPYFDLKINKPTPEQVLKIPAALARQYRVVLVAEDADTITIATDFPEQTNISQAVQTLFPDKKIILTYSLEEDLDATLLYYRKPLETRFGEIIKTQTHIAPEIIGEIFEDALAYNASDIHFEPQEKEILVRFRIDGVLHEAGIIPKEFYDNILNRIKVQSKLRIDEHFAAQDGALRYTKSGGIPVDFRVSILPTLDGEKIVIRLLSQYIRSFTLSDLGLSPLHQKILEEAANKPFGMILVTGPTGSGKTTTLYALLKILNSPDANITTIEDPVEYKLVGVNQIQVNTQTKLTFANGLRSILRQDPDVILVGEIRDEETVEIGVNAALTGHLVLSTFHANDAATGIPRLLDMGAEPFLLASTLEVIIAQRLVRKICVSCRVSRQEISRYFPKGESTVYMGKGCSNCSNTGYKGRTAIFEFIKITPAMKELILKRPSTQELWALARQEGAHTLFEDGIEKVMNGETTLEELLRVAAPPDNLK